MLNRLESAYLSILRVVILIAATLALIIAALGAMGAVPLLLEKAGILSTNEAGTSLADFVGEKKVASNDVADSEPASDAVHPDLAAAARNIHQYLGERSSYPASHWESVLQGFWLEVPAEADDAYAVSVRDLSEELLESTGSPLSLEQIEELLLWHFQRYLQNLQDRAAQQAAADAEFYMVMGAAISAFLVFVFIVFIFLFVKIERSLRLVRTVREDQGTPLGEAYDA